MWISALAFSANIRSKDYSDKPSENNINFANMIGHV